MNENFQTHALTCEDIPIVILCGGRSSRMKTDKSLLPFCGYHSLAHYQFERLCKSFTKVYISSKKMKFDFALPKEQLILDESMETYSPLIALKTVLQSLKAPQVFIMTVDTPFVSISSIKKLMNMNATSDVTVASTPNRGHHLCGVFSKNILANIEKMLTLDIHKIGYLLQEVQAQTVRFENEQEFMNLNTQTQYQAALKYISQTNK